MKDRWQKALEDAVAAYDTSNMPWKRGTQRQAMIARRKIKDAEMEFQRKQRRQIA